MLELEFRQSGEVYQYFDVPAEEYTAFLAADSKGTYVKQQLKLYSLERRCESENV